MLMIRASSTGLHLLFTMDDVRPSTRVRFDCVGEPIDNTTSFKGESLTTLWHSSSTNRLICSILKKPCCKVLIKIWYVMTSTWLLSSSSIHLRSKKSKFLAWPTFNPFNLAYFSLSHWSTPLRLWNIPTRKGV